MGMQRPEDVPHAIGEWIIEGLLGEGGMGSVFRGTHESTGLSVAIKLLPKHMDRIDERYRERFFREASIATRMQHPNMVHVRDSGEHAGYYYLVMDYVEGMTCRDYVEDNGPMGWQRAVALALDVATGLEYALARGIIHRDISPGNIIIDSEGRARITDMGLAKENTTELVGLTRTGSSLGTPYYMSPEQINDARDVDFRSDIYSLGATLYHMICGTVPYTGTTFEVMTKQVTVPLPDPTEHVPDLPSDVCDIIRKTMAKSPDNRYESYEALRDDLNALLQGRSPSAAGFRDPSMVAQEGQAPVHSAEEINSRAMDKTLIIEPSKSWNRTGVTVAVLAALAVLIALVLWSVLG